jgi:hypothetical protein
MLSTQRAVTPQQAAHAVGNIAPDGVRDVLIQR